MLSKDEVEQLMNDHHASPQNRTAQIRLAQEVTKIVHGEKELATAEAITQVLIGKKPLAELDDAALEAMRKEIPTAHAGAGAEIAELLVQTGLAISKTEARRFLQENAIAINGQKIQKETLDAADFQNGRLLIRKGRAFKDSALVES